MKILVLGDFHGKLSNVVITNIRKVSPDIIISTGDYLPFHYRKLWFEHCFGTDLQLWEVIGKEEYKKIIIKDLDLGEKALKQLNSLNIPVLTVLGNVDHPSADDVADEEKLKGKAYWAWEYSRESQFEDRLKKYKNIERIDYSYSLFQDLVFVGARGHSFPGRVKSKAFRKYKKILENLFKKFKKENKNRKVIFVSHNVPYNTKLDLITSKSADKLVAKQHYGSKLVRKIINRFQPVLNFGGHIHESRGIQRLGKTISVNPGAIHERKYAVVNISDKGKINVKLKS